jgi:cytochrome c oxidase subunit 2
MEPGFPLFPEQASTMAARVDHLYFFITAVCSFFAVLVTVLVTYFAIKYRRRKADEHGEPIHGSLALELAWTGIPFVLAMVMFVWGSSVYFALARVPDEAMDVYAVGKQWMWKFQHLDGQREINELHVPVGRPVKLIMTSEDVIHDLFVPAFRVKADVVPGRYTHLWFQPTKPGRYQLFCAEYCGTRHSGMTGSVVVMEPEDFQVWLSGGAQEGSLAAAGEKLFNDLACNTCHRPDARGRGPVLNNLFGEEQLLQNNERVIVDEAYIRESILQPAARITASYQPVMPTFQGLVSEEGLLELIEYIKSLKTKTPTPAARPLTDGPAPGENTPSRGAEAKD